MDALSLEEIFALGFAQGVTHVLISPHVVLDVRRVEV